MGTSPALHSLAPPSGREEGPSLPQPPRHDGSSSVMDKGLSSVTNLVKLLPSSTVLAFQALYPSFSNRGSCYTSNKCLTSALVLLCTASCILFSFTDSVVGADGKLYFGIATRKGFFVFNFQGSEEENGGRIGELAKLRIQPLDYVHAVLSALVFLTLAMGEEDVVGCFFPGKGEEMRQWMENLPLGVAVLATLVFIMFPTTRKGIGYSERH